VYETGAHLSGDFKKHHNYIVQAMGWNLGASRCGPPVRQVISLAELGPVLQHGYSYDPGFTLLYRCSGETGGCSDSVESCGPTKTETVELAFKASLFL
jgi:hypothetical protein